MNVLFAELVRRPMEEVGKSLQMTDVAFDGPGSPVAQLQILDEALTKWSHNSPHEYHSKVTLAGSCGKYGTRKARAQIRYNRYNRTKRLALWM